jgi:hypothetical protein
MTAAATREAGQPSAPGGLCSASTHHAGWITFNAGWAPGTVGNLELRKRADRCVRLTAPSA